MYTVKIQGAKTDLFGNLRALLDGADPFLRNS